MKNFKQKSISLLLIVAVALGSFGCKKDNDDDDGDGYICATCKTTPDALAANNAGAKGIYKGLVVGSSGVITIDVQNSDGTASSTMVLDGQIIDLVSESIVEAGGGFSGTFTGTGGGETYSFTFTVMPNGADPEASEYNIPGHTNIGFLILKETSDNLIKCYEGTTTGVKDNGNAQGSTLNFVASGKTNTWFALSKDNNSSEINASSGTISGDTFTCDCGPNTTVVGHIDNDEINGTYKGEDNHGTFEAKRTL